MAVQQPDTRVVCDEPDDQKPGRWEHCNIASRWICQLELRRGGEVGIHFLSENPEVVSVEMDRMWLGASQKVKATKVLWKRALTKGNSDSTTKYTNASFSFSFTTFCVAEKSESLNRVC
jgi:hypothetical protein